MNIKIGKKYKVVASKFIHSFHDGAIVTVVGKRTRSLWECSCEGYKYTQYFEDEDLAPVKRNILQRLLSIIYTKKKSS